MNSSLPLHYRSNGSVQVHYATDCSVKPRSWPKSLLHAASHSLNTLHTPYLCPQGQTAVGEKGRGR